ncbi:general secretion pathway protein GspB [Shewanella youngdeokensis]|uniref:General secretion pathway protein GspB n=1 Tax=Shewanella youngdeokensis TaxID=2999068 RepID=A0ABZ0JY12_9GAMM|nr:general secretion pathway protein GspB [Shewanella sp. DAU334]
MSILLDAVTKDKQQSQAIQHDVVLTPRAPYQASHSESVVTRLAVFVSLLIFTVALAWVLSQFIASNNLAANQIKPVAEQEPINTSLAADTKISSLNGSEPSVMLAGKVTLPIAKAQPRAELQPAANMVTKAPANSLMAQVLSAQQSIEAQASSADVKPQAESLKPEAIILGANANQRGQDVLASLQYEVDLAAADVGLDKKPTENAQKSHDLVAAFEAALKEVELENSVSAPVTEPLLDPIPAQAKNDGIPKYGQLPASLQRQVPEFNINAHVYSTIEDHCWLSVDGTELQQGDKIQGKLTIVEIRPRDVVLSIQGTEFTVPAI